MVSSFTLTIDIQHIETNTGDVYPLYHHNHTVFLDPFVNNTTPLQKLSSDSATTTAFFDASLDVGDYGWQARRERFDRPNPQR